jgi:hypothetical protein
VTILVTIDEPDPTSNDRFGGKAAAPAVLDDRHLGHPRVADHADTGRHRLPGRGLIRMTQLLGALVADAGLDRFADPARRPR